MVYVSACEDCDSTDAALQDFGFVDMGVSKKFPVFWGWVSWKEGWKGEMKRVNQYPRVQTEELECRPYGGITLAWVYVKASVLG